VHRPEASERSSAVLFLASGESNFGLMAEGWVRKIAGGSLSALSAATNPLELHLWPMRSGEVGVGISSSHSESQRHRGLLCDLVATWSLDSPASPWLNTPPHFLESPRSPATRTGYAAGGLRACAIGSRPRSGYSFSACRSPDHPGVELISTCDGVKAHTANAASAASARRPSSSPLKRRTSWAGLPPGAASDLRATLLLQW
jgi:hypothetical protein